MGLLKDYVLSLSVLCVVLGGQVVEGKGYPLETERQLQVERKLQLLNKPAVKSIQSDDGDIIDCIDIYKQPAFDHPLLKNHKIQLRPGHDLFGITEEKATSSFLSSQLWQRNGSCPKGTVPIRRVQRHHLLNAPSIENFGMKRSSGILKREFQVENVTFDVGIEALNSYAVLVTGGFSYTGAQGNINVWNPSVEVDDEYSSAQIWLRNGPYNDSDSIECGWIVNPAVYGDTRTRLFIYWTIDSGKTTGCFDLICPGFVQISHEIALGSVIDPISVIDGDQYHIGLSVLKDYVNDCWWLVFGNETIVGYWPSTLFRSLDTVATLVLWGGDVYSPRTMVTPHTATAMGSGRFAFEHWSHASFIQKPRIMDYSFTFKYPYPYQPISPRTDCYSAENWAEILFTEPLFYFGGPGRNMYCP